MLLNEGLLSSLVHFYLTLHTLYNHDSKQLLDEVQHQNRGQCCLPKPKASADNTDTSF